MDRLHALNRQESVNTAIEWTEEQRPGDQSKRPRLHLGGTGMHCVLPAASTSSRAAKPAPSML